MAVAVAGELSLPPELLQEIARHLSVSDLLSVSLTCRYLRAALNNDQVWQQHVPPRARTLDPQDAQVQPLLLCVQSLTPLCAERLHYVKSVLVRNNLRRGRFTEHSHETQDNERALVDEEFIRQHPFLISDRFLLVCYLAVTADSNRASKRIQVWDTHSRLKQHCVLNFGNIAYGHYFIIGLNLVCCRKYNSRSNCRVDVYRINLPKKEFPILYSFFTTERKVSWRKLASRRENQGQKFTGWTHFTQDSYLVSRVTSGDRRMVFHVWDITNAAKVGSFAFPIQVSTISLQPFSSNQMWYLRGDNSQNKEQYYYTFDPEKKRFSDVVFSYRCSQMSSRVIFYKSVVLLIEELIYPTAHSDQLTSCHQRSSEPFSSERYINCTLYDLASSKEIIKRCFNTNRVVYPIKLIDIVNGSFVILSFNSFHFVDVLTLNTLQYFECDISFHCVLQQYVMFQSVLALVKDCDDGLCLWDIRNKRKLPDKLAELIEPGSSVIDLFSKIVIAGKSKISIAYFW